MADPTSSVALRALQNRNFAIYTAGNTFSLIGMWVQRVAIGLLIWQLTGSKVLLGTLALAEVLPIFLLTPLGGVMADQFDRKRLLVFCLSVSCLQAFLLFFLTLFDLITPSWIIALTAVAGIMFAINQTARLTLVPAMLPRDLMGSAISITSVIFNLARFVGPLIGGAIIAQFDFAMAFLFNAVSFISIIVALLVLDLPPFTPRDRSDPNPFKSFATDFVAGCRYTLSHPSIGVLIGMITASAFLARPFSELLPGLVDVFFGKGEEGLSILLSAMGLGAIVAGILLANRADTAGLRPLVTIAILVNAICIIAFASVDNFWAAVVLIAISGFAQTISGTGSQTLVQHDVEEEMRGRVLSLWSITIRGGPAIGAFLIGALAEFMGFAPPIIMGGLLCLALVAFMGLKRRAQTPVKAASD